MAQWMPADAVNDREGALRGPCVPWRLAGMTSPASLSSHRRICRVGDLRVDVGQASVWRSDALLLARDHLSSLADSGS